jgi:enediyne biosynthesis protein E4
VVYRRTFVRSAKSWRRLLVGHACWALVGSVSPASLMAEPAPPAFERVIVPFAYENGMTGRLYFPEMTGGGGALFDYDGDGDLDLYLVQGGALGPDAGMIGGGGQRGESGRDVLLRNDGGGSGVLWNDVTAAAGLEGDGYGMAVATGDYDGDGWIDLLVGNYGMNQLWRNRGDGTFNNASRALGEAKAGWTTGAAFVDYDGDGLEDLYLVNYVEYSVAEAPACYAPSTRQDYCGPSDFKSQADRLLRNSGDGTFVDATAGSGVGAVAGSGLGVAVLDVDGDGRIELYVSNDGQPNFLWRIENGRWVDDALLSGVAVNGRGEPEAGMGIAVGDYDRDGDEDILVAHLSGETNTLYVNQGGGLFDDLSSESGLAAPSLPYTAFGASWLDLDHDGWLDLAVANGAVRIQEAEVEKGEPYPLGQRNQLFTNRRGRFEEGLDEAFTVDSAVGRGLVRGDVDNDGDEDLVVVNSEAPAALFLNTGEGAGNWLGVSLVRPEHQALTAEFEDGSRFLARASSSGSYASAADPRVILGGTARMRTLSIHLVDRVIRLISPTTQPYLRVGP